jgi:hypothetical protein
MYYYTRKAISFHPDLVWFFILWLSFTTEIGQVRIERKDHEGRVWMDYICQRGWNG